MKFQLDECQDNMILYNGKCIFNPKHALAVVILDFNEYNCTSSSSIIRFKSARISGNVESQLKQDMIII